MKKINLTKLIMMTATGALIILGACEKDESPSISTGDEQEGILKSGNGAESYIIVLNDDFEASDELVSTRGYDKRRDVMSSYLNRFLNGKGVGNDQVDQVFSNVYMGFSARLSPPQLDRLQNDPRINYIEKDQGVSLGKPKNPGGKDNTPPPQVVPPGITRVGGGSAYSGSGKAWIIDTGIDYSHPDLNVDESNSKTFVNRTSTANDDNGHGTHCAGIIAAINNEIGVVGVAAGAQVVAVKVLNKRGSGSWSTVIAGIDYVAANASAGDVANLSLGGGTSKSVDNAVIALGNGDIGKGHNPVNVAIAAGNESGDANNHSPARANGPNLYTVSAMNSSDNWASFSNYGNPPIDYCAPGYRILSCYKNGGFATLSGTSMAAPHVAGLLLLGNVTADGTVNGDPDGTPDPIAHN